MTPMDARMQDKNKVLRRRWILWTAILIGLGSILFWFWPTVRTILVTMAAAAAISFLLSPVVNLLEKWMPRWLGVSVTFGVMVLALGLALYLVVPGLVRQGSMLVGQFPDYIKALTRLESNISNKLTDMGLPRDMTGKWQDIVKNAQTGVTEWAGNFVTSVPDRISFLPELVAIPVIVSYLISDQKKFKRITMRLIPAQHRESMLKLTGRIRSVLYGYLQGELVNALVVGVLTTAAFLVIGVPYGLLLGTLAGACEIIPYFGPYLSVIPIAIITLIEAPDKIWWTLGSVLVIQQIQGSVISPIILSGHVKMHPLAVILLLLAGLAAGGILGMILILPLALIAREIVEFVYQRAVYAKTLLRITRGDS